ncbi:fibrinogen alpha chain-like [Phyllobates terribilis]|uniref:fibrinogen alpha chain-like n=1 Tax=Phyllobates terribilis TaxID=111132 RepID=UPI003CCA77E0
MKILEVDIDIKIRTCKGSCQNVQAFMTNLENYRSWKKDLEAIRNYQIDDTKTLQNIGFVNLNAQKNATYFKELWPLMEMKQLEMFESMDQYMLKLEDV